MNNIIGSREVIARAVSELNKNLPVDFSKYNIKVGAKCSYFYGFLDELSNIFVNSVRDANKPYPAIINLLPEGAKMSITSEGIKFKDQALLILMPVLKEWTSEEVSYYCHALYLRLVAKSLIDSLAQFATLEADYDMYEGSGLAMTNSEEEKKLVDSFGDYLAYIYIDGLNYFIPKIICETTYKNYQEIFETVNK
jgi:hypothetical protein